MGWFDDNDVSTPDVGAMLESRDGQIVLTLPIKGMRTPENPYAGWFFEGLIGDRTNFGKKPPRVTKFLDSFGEVILVGCRATEMQSSFTAGHGKIVANYAVFGGTNYRYEKVNGLRTELPALLQWTGLASLTEDITHLDGVVSGATLKLDHQQEVPISRRMNLKLRPTFTWHRRPTGTPGELVIQDSVQLETTSRVPKSWSEHLSCHTAIRELISISAGHSFGFSLIEASRNDDAVRSLDDTVIEPRWAKVLTYRLPHHENWQRTPLFLFAFNEIGTKGISRWMTLRSHFERGLTPLVGIVDREPDLPSLNHVVDSGIALDALGYQIAKDRNSNRINSRGQLTYKDALQEILENMPFVPVVNIEDWKQRSHSCYMGLKHADRSVPDSLTLANTLRENLLVLRYWVAGRIGCPRKLLKERLSVDPRACPYMLSED